MTLLRSMARQGLPLEDILRQMNDELLDQNPRGMFVTLQCLVFDLAHGRVTCANAGHMWAVRLHGGAAPALAFCSSGLVLGLLPGFDVTTETLDLQVGDAFVLYTDGVSEAFDTNGDFYGDERLIENVRTARGATARDITLGVLESVRQHASGAPQSDDITVVSVRYGGPVM
jgi:phosphoserine phosphatase RsbU/P